jgi:hypothetical protein
MRRKEEVKLLTIVNNQMIFNYDIFDFAFDNRQYIKPMTEGQRDYIYKLCHTKNVEVNHYIFNYFHLANPIIETLKRLPDYIVCLGDDAFSQYDFGRRIAIYEIYKSEKWREKINKMSAGQVCAIYHSLVRAGKIKEAV